MSKPKDEKKIVQTIVALNSFFQKTNIKNPAKRLLKTMPELFPNEPFPDALVWLGRETHCGECEEIAQNFKGKRYDEINDECLFDWSSSLCMMPKEATEYYILSYIYKILQDLEYWHAHDTVPQHSILDYYDQYFVAVLSAFSRYDFDVTHFSEKQKKFFLSVFLMVGNFMITNSYCLLSLDELERCVERC